MWPLVMADVEMNLTGHNVRCLTVEMKVHSHEESINCDSTSPVLQTGYTDWRSHV